MLTIFGCFPSKDDHGGVNVTHETCQRNYDDNADSDADADDDDADADANAYDDNDGDDDDDDDDDAADADEDDDGDENESTTQRVNVRHLGRRKKQTIMHIKLNQLLALTFDSCR